MILLGHNAHLITIQTPIVPADPGKGIIGSVAVTRWTGDAQAFIDEDLVDEIRGSQRVRVSQTIIDLPINIPIWPDEEDQLVIVRQGVLARFDAESNPQTENYVVRFIDGGLVMLGKLRLRVVRAPG